jgi:hypothetical protein
LPMSSILALLSMCPDTVLSRIGFSEMVRLWEQKFLVYRNISGSISSNRLNLSFPRFFLCDSVRPWVYTIYSPVLAPQAFHRLTAGSTTRLCSSAPHSHRTKCCALTVTHFALIGDSFRCSLPRSGFIHCSSIQLIESELASFTSGIAVLCLRGCVSTIVFSVLTALLVVGRRQAASAWACQRGRFARQFSPT